MILSKMGDLTIGYALTFPQIFTMSNPEYVSLHLAFENAMKVLPAGYIIHKQDWFTEETFCGDFEKEHSFLSHSSERFFHERPYLSHKSFLLLTMPAKDRRRVNSNFSSLLRKHIVPAETLDPAFAKSFEGVCSQFVRIVSENSLISCKRLVEDELVRLVNEYLVLDTDGVRRDMDFSEGVRVGEKYCTMFSLSNAADLPAMCGPRINYDKYSTDTSRFPVGFVSPLCQLLPVNHIYHQFIRIEDPSAVITKLEKRKLRLQSLSAYSRDNLIARDATDQFLQEAVSETSLDGFEPVRTMTLTRLNQGGTQ